MMFEQLGPWMRMIVYLKNKDGKYIRELNLDEAEGSEELFATWIEPPWNERPLCVPQGNICLITQLELGELSSVKTRAAGGSHVDSRFGLSVTSGFVLFLVIRVRV